MDSVWMDLLNSDWHDYRGSGRSEDRLESPDWLRGFLTRWEGAFRKIPIREIRLALRELRSLIQQMVNSVVAGHPISENDMESLNSILAAAPVVRHLVKDQNKCLLTLVPTVRNLDSVLAEIALSFAETIAHGDPARIKICENSDCRWVFYDRSRNRTRIWCEDSACGNLMKVRRFRARQKRKSRARSI